LFVWARLPRWMDGEVAWGAGPPVRYLSSDVRSCLIIASLQEINHTAASVSFSRTLVIMGLGKIRWFEPQRASSLSPTYHSLIARVSVSRHERLLCLWRRVFSNAYASSSRKDWQLRDDPGLCLDSSK
jgi:hypothetical protein